MMYTEKRIRSYVDRFTFWNGFINRLELIADPSAELVLGIAELKAMRAKIVDDAVAYIEAPFKEAEPP